MQGVPDPPLDLVATPTRVERLDRLSDEHGAELYVKRDDATGGIAHGNKLRKLEYLLGDALAAGADAVVTCGAVQSNHCRAVATTARRLGLGVSLVLVGDEPDRPDGNLLVDRLVGADVEYVPLTEFEGFDAHLTAAADRLRAAGETPYTIPLGGSTPRGTLGYVRAYDEIHRHERREGVAFDRVVTAVGSGGTVAGLLAGARYHGAGTDVVGVDVTPYGETHVRQLIGDLLAGVDDLVDRPPLDPGGIAADATVRTGYVGPGYGTPAEADLETMAAVGRREGLVLDPTYTAKAFRAFLDHTDPGDTALFVHTGGSYGLFPHREAIAEHL